MCVCVHFYSSVDSTFIPNTHSHCILKTCSALLLFLFFCEWTHWHNGSAFSLSHSVFSREFWVKRCSAKVWAASSEQKALMSSFSWPVTRVMETFKDWLGKRTISKKCVPVSQSVRCLLPKQPPILLIHYIYSMRGLTGTVLWWEGSGQVANWAVLRAACNSVPLCAKVLPFPRAQE